MDVPQRDGLAPAFTLRSLQPGDAVWLREVQVLFAQAFEDPEAASATVPAAHYESLLNSQTFLAIAALKGTTVVGALTAYELPRLEPRRKEIHLYDLAVAAAHRRQGIASALIRELQLVAQRRGASAIFVQAHPEDLPAVTLYTKLGTPEPVLHFDIPPAP